MSKDTDLGASKNEKCEGESVICKRLINPRISGEWLMPKKEKRYGALLYFVKEGGISPRELCRYLGIRVFVPESLEREDLKQALDYMIGEGYSADSIVVLLPLESDLEKELGDNDLKDRIFRLSADLSREAVLKAADRFLVLAGLKKRSLRWLRLDNAAKIYPAARHRNWSNVYRLSVTLREDVDRAVLERALEITLKRFPSIAVRLRKGFFWYYLEQLPTPPSIREEHSYPLTRMTNREMGKCALRVIVYKRRLAVELFHSLTDGSSALVFIKTLLCEYIQQKHGICIPNEKGILSRTAPPQKEELEDSFLKYAGPVSASRRESTAWHLFGERETGGFQHLTCFKLPVGLMLEKAHSHNVSLTAFLCAVMMKAILDLQAKKVPQRKKRRPVKVLIPINLRNLFDSRSLRNFALYTSPEADPRLGEYSFGELCEIVRHRMALEATDKYMSTRIATNVASEKSLFVKLMPLFIKNIVMKAVFCAVGERKSCLSLSNLGAVKLPDELSSYVERFDFVLGVQASAPHNCGVLSFGDTLYINIIRNIKEPELELAFYETLRGLGICPLVESNSSNMRS